MSKKAENTFQLPYQLEREYHLLMKTKESFLKNLTNAECRKLETLYEQLIDVWNQNNIQNLSEVLNQKYQELREIQQLKESTSKDYEQIMNLESKTLRAGIRTKVERKYKEEFDRISNESTRLNTEETEFTKSIEEHRSRIEEELSKTVSYHCRRRAKQI